MMRRVLLLVPILAASGLLIGFGTLMYAMFVDPYIARLGATQLRLSDDVTHVCVGFTASWCDETWRAGPDFIGQTKSCGVAVISRRPTVPVVWVSDENALCRPYKRTIRPPTWVLLFLGFAVPFYVTWKLPRAQ